VQSRLDHARYPVVILSTADLELPTRSGIIGCGGNCIAVLCFLGRIQWVMPYEMILTSEPKDLLMAKENNAAPQRRSHAITKDHLPIGMDDFITVCSHFVPEAVM
jgi:hypothetical protein